MSSAKQPNNSISTYERIILFKNIPYWMYWLAIGTLGTLLGQIILRASHEKTLFWTALMIGVGGVGIYPTVLVWMAKHFYPTYMELSTIFWNDRKECENWVNNEFRKTFTLETHQVKLIIVFIVTLALVTISLIGLPFQSKIVNILATSGYILFAVICGQGAHVALNLLGVLSKVTKLKPNSPFYLSKPLPIISLLNYYSYNALFTTAGYIILTIAVWQGPYGFSFELQIWLAILAFFPLSMFFWSYYQIHIMLLKIKQEHLKVINQEVHRNLEKVLIGDTLESVERLDKVMGIQKKIQETSDWPVDFQGTATFVITLATAIIQIILAVTGFFKS